MSMPPRDDGSRRLIELFENLSGLERSYLICTMTTSRQPRLRAVAALFLQSRAGMIGATECIEQLAHDDDPLVRRLAARAAEARGVRLR